METCVFCKILNKQIPAEMIYENLDFAAFLSINPESPGHTLVIPKKHYRWVWDVPNIGEYFEVVRKVALAQRKAYETEMILSRVYGEEVQHAHVWIYPHPSVAGDKKDLVKNAEKIRKNL